MPIDLKQITERTCTAARIISALCEIIDGQELTNLTDQYPSPYGAALLEAQQLGLPEPYIWEID